MFFFIEVAKLMFFNVKFSSLKTKVGDFNLWYVHLLLVSNSTHTTAVKVTGAFNYWPTKCLHVRFFLGTSETSKEHVLSRTPTLQKLKQTDCTWACISKLFSVLRA